MCSDLRNIFDKDYMSTKLQSLKEASSGSGGARSPALETEAFPEAVVSQSPSTAASIEASPQHRGEQIQTPTHDYAQEIERLMDVSHDMLSNLHDIIPSPRETPSLGAHDISPSTTQILGSTPVTMAETTTPGTRESTGTGVFPTPDFLTSASLGESDLERPAFFDERNGQENARLSGVPELDSAAEAEVSFRVSNFSVQFHLCNMYVLH